MGFFNDTNQTNLISFKVYGFLVQGQHLRVLALLFVPNKNY